MSRNRQIYSQISFPELLEVAVIVISGRDLGIVDWKSYSVGKLNVMMGLKDVQRCCGQSDFVLM